MDPITTWAAASKVTHTHSKKRRRGIETMMPPPCSMFTCRLCPLLFTNSFEFLERFFKIHLFKICVTARSILNDG